MDQRLHSAFVLMLAVFALPSSANAQLIVLTSGGFVDAYEELRPAFEKAKHVSITMLRGASQGTEPTTIGAQLRRAVHADVVILSRDGLAELLAEGRIAEGTQTDLARVPLGVGVRAGAAHPDITTVAAFTQTVLHAKSIGIRSTSGNYLTTTVFPKLGIADAVAGKLKSGSAREIAAGDAEIAVLPVSELVHKPGVDYIGTIPAEIQLVQVFTAAILKSAKNPELSKQLIAFLASKDASAAISKSGMEPLRR
jgi:molybdate transport system substrate-binding protein